MKIYIYTIIYFFVGSFLMAQNKDKTVENYQNLLHKNSKVLGIVKGDLNKDGKPDLALIVEDFDKKYIKYNDGFGSDTLNLSPRRILVLLQTANKKYKVVAENSDFIPSQNDEESTCLADPIMEQENAGLSIEKGLLKFSSQYWYSCGSWYVSNITYTFRYQKSQMELIGFDQSDFHRSSGEETSTSINFSTKKRVDISGMNMFEDTDVEPEETWSTVKINVLYNLNTINKDTFLSFFE